ncbi:MAG: bifunctional [glutamate--ammonia ligase]-adenylyl-L-tyrosine phosphorylase/[glutamate--ammonia-ligase] adenylyltransferase [Deltaproteobacteria bacterium]|nr:bifunctional [glutamate--ammonia ligase]-adenylyl-L-tyrosine phosphorylase/[glutamate--ammonia-ligase] adenylyltransferase [Deltaproteobacteria bacterium]
MTAELLSIAESEASKKLQAMGFADGAGALKNLKLLASTPFSGHLESVTQWALASPSPDGALNNLETIVSNLSQDAIGAALADPMNIERLITIAGSSPFLSNILTREAALFTWLFSGGIFEVKDYEVFRADLRERTSGVEGFDRMAKALRVYKQKEYLRIGSRDLAGLSNVEEVTRELSDLAGASLDCALEYSLKYHKALHGPPIHAGTDGEENEAQFSVIGLGKLGGRELNFSSDIDIIYIYSSDKGETNGVGGRPESRVSLHAFFVKVSMMVSRLISSVTEDGFVFRVDLNLRPEGKSGDMANSLRSAEIYYESWGQSWERAAMIKARPVAGSLSLGEEFLSMIRPFVFRRYLDFTAIEEVKTMKEKIDLSLLRRNPDAIDVKLGAGGIREIEFFCQALQLIHAGKNPDIRDRNTLNAIEKLKRKGFIKDFEAATLKAGYIFLRNLEHRIQVVEGRQSQAIPPRPHELERLARMMGFRDIDGRMAGTYFWEEYKKKTNAVHEVYRSLFYRSEEEAVEVPPDILALLSPDITEEEAGDRLKALGFRDAKEAFKNMTLLRTGPAYMHLSARARVILQKLAPVFLLRACASPDPDRALSNLERFISAIGARTTFYSLLYENPRVLEELVRLFGTSVFLSRSLIERPESLDILLSDELAVPYKTRRDFFDEFLREIENRFDYEERLDILRRLKSRETFRIGLNGVLGTILFRQISSQLTFMAEASLEAAVKIASDELKRSYGEPADARFAVIGLGKLGGRELTYGSDLDIIFVYDDPTDGKTTGPRSLSNHEYFVRLGQRIISVLTLKTREGHVFSVDARLRPSGSAGPLVVERHALVKYHREKTLVWERQAFTKARAVAGDTAFGRDVLNELSDIVYSKPLTPDDVDEMLRVRKRMEDEIAKESAARYNIKTGKGGVVDIEFLVQSLQLSYGSAKRPLRTPYTLKALHRLLREGIIMDADYAFLKEAYSFYRLLETKLRIVHDRPEGYLVRGSEELLSLARRTGYTGEAASEELLADYAKRAEKVRSLYTRILAELKEKKKD